MPLIILLGILFPPFGLFLLILCLYLKLGSKAVEGGATPREAAQLVVSALGWSFVVLLIIGAIRGLYVLSVGHI